MTLKSDPKLVALADQILADPDAPPTLTIAVFMTAWTDDDSALRELVDAAGNSVRPSE